MHRKLANCAAANHINFGQLALWLAVSWTLSAWKALVPFGWFSQSTAFTCGTYKLDCTIRLYLGCWLEMELDERLASVYWTHEHRSLATDRWSVSICLRVPNIIRLDASASGCGVSRSTRIGRLGLEIRFQFTSLSAWGGNWWAVDGWFDGWKSRISIIQLSHSTLTFNPFCKYLTA